MCASREAAEAAELAAIRAERPAFNVVGVARVVPLRPVAVRDSVRELADMLGVAQLETRRTASLRS